MPARKTDAPSDPDRLVRQAAGDYRTEDDRFEVRQADVGWFLVDSEQSNEFGQELIHGPYATLKAVRQAIPGARDAKARAKPMPARPAARRRTERAPARPPPPPTWVDELPSAEGRSVRKLIAALEREGIEDAEALVRRDRDGLLPAVAARLIASRLAALVDQVPAGERDAARQLVGRVAEVLSGEGTTLTEPLPGWVLVEVGPEDEPPKHRRIDLS